MPPGDTLSAESLKFIHQYRRTVPGRRLTLRMTSKSLVIYTRTTFTATNRPLYVLRDTLAKPPDSTSTEPSEQSGMCMDFGITRCRLHVLQSSLNSFSHSRSGAVCSSKCYRSCWPWDVRRNRRWRDGPYPFRQRASGPLSPNLSETGGE